MDAMGHVNNTVYFRYMEQARIALVRGAACRAARPGRATGIVIVNASLQLQEPLDYPGTVEVKRVRSASPGGSSVATLLRAERGRTSCTPTARPKVVFVDAENAEAAAHPATTSGRSLQ